MSAAHFARIVDGSGVPICKIKLILHLLSTARAWEDSLNCKQRRTAYWPSASVFVGAAAYATLHTCSTPSEEARCRAETRMLLLQCILAAGSRTRELGTRRELAN